jgi:hypothetical protein
MCLVNRLCLADSLSWLLIFVETSVVNANSAVLFQGVTCRDVSCGIVFIFQRQADNLVPPSKIAIEIKAR